MRPAKGFTVVELMITLAVAAILLALAIPSFREISLNNQRAAKTNELLTALNYARGQALGLRRTTAICRSSDTHLDSATCGDGNGWEEGWLVVVDGDSDGTVDPDASCTDASACDMIVRRRDRLISSSELARPAADRFTIRGNAAVAERVVFQASGTIGNGPSGLTVGTLAVCDQRAESKGRAIVVSTAGRVRSEENVSSCNR